MDDYIKRADALKMKFHDGINDDGQLYVPYRDVEKHLRQLPAADVRENIHGNWVGIDDFPYEEFECDRCGYIIEVASGASFANFCPNCGADMWR